MDVEIRLQLDDNANPEAKHKTFAALAEIRRIKQEKGLTWQNR